MYLLIVSEKNPFSAGFDGLRVEVVRGRAEAMTAIARRVPELIVIKSNATAPERLALLEELRDRTDTGTTPIVFVADDSDEVAEALSSGASDALPVSVGANELDLRVRRQLAVRAERLQLERLTNLVFKSADGIIVLNAKGRIDFANARAIELLDVGGPEALGKGLRDFVHKADHSLAISTWNSLKRDVSPGAVDLRIAKPKGELMVCNCSFARLSQDPDSFLIALRDVTETRRSEEELMQTKEFLESLIDASVDGIIAVDTSGTVILFNKGAERIYGYEGEQAIGVLTFEDLFLQGVSNLILERVGAEEHGGPGRLENTRVNAKGADGEMIPISLSAAIIYEDGAPAATFAVFTDLREKLDAQEKLAQAQEQLAVSEKQALIAELAGTAAHELNQPLTSVMGYAELLVRRLERDTPERRAIEVILCEAERMADIVRKIGKITKYETKSYVGSQKILDLDKAVEDTGLRRVPGE